MPGNIADRALPDKTQEPSRLLPQRVIRVTLCRGGDDEWKQPAVLHGFFQGTHCEHIHRKIKFRQVSERSEPKVNKSYHQGTICMAAESCLAIISSFNELLIRQMERK